MNNVITNILTRRSIRKYKQEQVSDQDLNLILEAGTYAPSGFNSQSWHFTVVQNKDLLTELNLAVKNTLLALDTSNPKFAFLQRAQSAAKNDSFCFYYNAPTLIIVSNVANYSNAMADSSCAIENMFLAAHSLGLGTCWLNQLGGLSNAPAVKSVLDKFNIPNDHIICGSLSLGYSDMPTLSASPRKENTVTIIK